MGLIDEIRQQDLELSALHGNLEYQGVDDGDEDIYDEDDDEYELEDENDDDVDDKLAGGDGHGSEEDDDYKDEEDEEDEGQRADKDDEAAEADDDFTIYNRFRTVIKTEKDLVIKQILLHHVDSEVFIIAAGSNSKTQSGFVQFFDMSGKREVEVLTLPKPVLKVSIMKVHEIPFYSLNDQAEIPLDADLLMTACSDQIHISSLVPGKFHVLLEHDIPYDFSSLAKKTKGKKVESSISPVGIVAHFASALNESVATDISLDKVVRDKKLKPDDAFAEKENAIRQLSKAAVPFFFCSIGRRSLVRLKFGQTQSLIEFTARFISGYQRFTNTSFEVKIAPVENDFSSEASFECKTKNEVRVRIDLKRSTVQYDDLDPVSYSYSSPTFQVALLDEDAVYFDFKSGAANNDTYLQHKPDIGDVWVRNEFESALESLEKMINDSSDHFPFEDLVDHAKKIKNFQSSVNLDSLQMLHHFVYGYGIDTSNLDDKKEAERRKNDVTIIVPSIEAKSSSPLNRKIMHKIGKIDSLATYKSAESDLNYVFVASSAGESNFIILHKFAENQLDIGDLVELNYTEETKDVFGHITRKPPVKISGSVTKVFPHKPQGNNKPDYKQYKYEVQEKEKAGREKTGREKTVIVTFDEIEVVRERMVNSKTISDVHDDKIRQIVAAKDFVEPGIGFLTGSEDRSIICWRLVETLPEEERLELKSEKTFFSKQGDAFYSTKSTLSIQNMRKFIGHQGAITAINLVRRGHDRLIVSASTDTTVRIWDVQCPQALRVLYGPSKEIVTLSTLDLVGGLVISCYSQDKSIQIWDLADSRGVGDYIDSIKIDCTEGLDFSETRNITTFDNFDGHGPYIIHGGTRWKKNSSATEDASKPSSKTSCIRAISSDKAEEKFFSCEGEIDGEDVDCGEYEIDSIFVIRIDGDSSSKTKADRSIKTQVKLIATGKKVSGTSSTIFIWDWLFPDLPPYKKELEYFIDSFSAYNVPESMESIGIIEQFFIVGFINQSHSGTSATKGEKSFINLLYKKEESSFRKHELISLIPFTPYSSPLQIPEVRSGKIDRKAGLSCFKILIPEVWKSEKKIVGVGAFKDEVLYAYEFSFFPKPGAKMIDSTIMEGHEGKITAVKIIQCPASEKDTVMILVSSSMDRTIRVWNYHTGFCMQVLEGSPKPVRCISCSKSHSNNIIASTSYDKQIRLWNVQTGQLTRVLTSNSPVKSLIAFCPRNGEDAVVAVSSDSQDITLLDGFSDCLPQPTTILKDFMKEADEIAAQKSVGWPRISQVIALHGSETVFEANPFLFSCLMRTESQDFWAKFMSNASFSIITKLHPQIFTQNNGLTCTGLSIQRGDLVHGAHGKRGKVKSFNLLSRAIDVSWIKQGIDETFLIRTGGRINLNRIVRPPRNEDLAVGSVVQKATIDDNVKPKIVPDQPHCQHLQQPEYNMKEFLVEASVPIGVVVALSKDRSKVYVQWRDKSSLSEWPEVIAVDRNSIRLVYQVAVPFGRSATERKQIKDVAQKAPELKAAIPTEEPKESESKFGSSFRKAARAVSKEFSSVGIDSDSTSKGEKENSKEQDEDKVTRTFLCFAQVGDKVMRGKDWKFGDNDGGVYSLGTICQIDPAPRMTTPGVYVWVTWDCDDDITKVCKYKYGITKKWEIQVVMLVCAKTAQPGDIVKGWKKEGLGVVRFAHPSTSGNGSIVHVEWKSGKWGRYSLGVNNKWEVQLLVEVESNLLHRGDIVQRAGGSDISKIGEEDDGGYSLTVSKEDPICGDFGIITSIDERYSLVSNNYVEITVDWEDGKKNCSYNYGAGDYPVRVVVHAEESMLHLAMLYRNLPSVRVIVTKWLELLGKAPESLLDYQNFPHHSFSDKDLYRLGKYFPLELEHFICSIKPLKLSSDIIGGIVQNQKIKPDGSIVIGVSQDNHTTAVSSIWEVALKTYNGPGDASPEPVTCLFLPLKNASDEEHLHLYVDTSNTLDSLNIFKTDCAVIASRFAWERFGNKIHVWAFARHMFFLAIYTLSIFLFDRFWNRSENGFLNFLAILFLLGVIFGNVIFIFEEVEQYTSSGENPIDHLKNIWNILNLSMIITTFIGTCLRFINGFDNSGIEDSGSSRSILGLGAILVWLKVLYYFRAFEKTGTLVSMIVAIGYDIRYFLVILAMAVFSFAQAFWILTNPNNTYGDDHKVTVHNFNYIDLSLLTTFNFMMGGYDPGEFDGSFNKSFAIFLSIVFIVYVSILLLNLLIALMGDTFARVQADATSQWHRERTSIMLENAWQLMNVRFFKSIRDVFTCFIFAKENPIELSEDGKVHDFSIFPDTLHVLKRTCDVNVIEDLSISRDASVIIAATEDSKAYNERGIKALQSQMKSIVNDLNVLNSRLDKLDQIESIINRRA